MDPHQLLLQIALGAASAAGGLVVSNAVRLLRTMFAIDKSSPGAVTPTAFDLPRILTPQQSRTVLEAWGRLSPRQVWVVAHKAVPGDTPADRTRRAELTAL